MRSLCSSIWKSNIFASIILANVSFFNIQFDLRIVKNILQYKYCNWLWFWIYYHGFPWILTYILLIRKYIYSSSQSGLFIIYILASLRQGFQLFTWNRPLLLWKRELCTTGMKLPSSEFLNLFEAALITVETLAYSLFKHKSVCPNLYKFTVCLLFIYIQESVPPEAGSVIRCVYAAETHLPGDGVHGARLSPELRSSASGFVQHTKFAQYLPWCQRGHAVPGG